MKLYIAVLMHYDDDDHRSEDYISLLRAFKDRNEAEQYIQQETAETIIDYLNHYDIEYEEVKEYVNKTKKDNFEFKPEVLKSKKIIDLLYEKYAIGEFVNYKFKWEIFEEEIDI